MKFLLIIFLSFQLCLTNGQSLAGDSIFGKNSQAKPGKGDTLLVLGYPYWGDVDVLDTAMELHIMPIRGIEYLLYKKGDKIYSRKSVGYFTVDFSNSLSANSDLLEITEDSIFAFVHTWFSQITKEKIKPYIYWQDRWDTINPTYQVLQSSHPTVSFVNVSTASDNISREIDVAALEEHHDQQCPVNLNYKANVNTKLFLFYQAMINLTTRLDKKYIFPTTKQQ